MKASFLIVNWNTRELTAKAVASVLEFEKEFPVEIIVVDNASTDGSADFLRKNFSNVTVIANQENVGFAKANNQAAKAAKGEWLILFNSDAYLAGAILQPMLSAAEKIGKPCLLGCRVLNPDGTGQLSALPFPTLGGYLVEAFTTIGRMTRAQFRYQERLDGDPKKVDWISGVIIMAPRSDYMKLGGLDETIFMYGEDMEFCRRAVTYGLPCYYSLSASIFHLGGGSENYRSLRSLILTDKGRIKSFRIIHGPLSALLLRGIFILRSLFRVALYGLPALPPASRFRDKLALHFKETLVLTGIADERNFI